LEIDVVEPLEEEQDEIHSDQEDRLQDEKPLILKKSHSAMYSNAMFGQQQRKVNKL